MGLKIKSNIKSQSRSRSQSRIKRSQPSAAPTWDWVPQPEIGRLSGRHREQAHSYKRAKANRVLFTTQQDER
jgi:hypothetical protein